MYNECDLPRRHGGTEKRQIQKFALCVSVPLWLIFFASTSRRRMTLLTCPARTCASQATISSDIF